VTAPLVLIGMDGGPPTASARAALRGATLVVGARRHLDAVEIPDAARVVELGELAAGLDAVVAADGPAVVLASGDPGFFGIVRALRARGLAPTVEPAVSSVAAAFARVGVSWDDALVVSAHGRPLGPVVAACRAASKVAVLTAPGAGPAELGAALAGARRCLHVATSLGTPQESVITVSPEQAAARSWQQPAVVVVVDPSSPDAGAGPGWLAGGDRTPDGWALDETAFGHRDSMVTKAEVRAVALARLAPRLGRVVWDLGTGSGSVAVECARFGADVVAFDHDPEACAQARANAEAYGVQVEVRAAMLPDGLGGVRAPNAVFLGGGGPAVLEAALAAGRPQRAVAALAAVDRVGPVLDVLARHGMRAGGSQIAASRLRALPDGSHRLVAANPVFVVWGERP
jgi:precorrin-6Y C5,15-methyltransferase (decarboxylating)